LSGSSGSRMRGLALFFNCYGFFEAFFQRGKLPAFITWIGRMRVMIAG